MNSKKQKSKKRELKEQRKEEAKEELEEEKKETKYELPKTRNSSTTQETKTRKTPRRKAGEYSLEDDQPGGVKGARKRGAANSAGENARQDNPPGNVPLNSNDGFGERVTHRSSRGAASGRRNLRPSRQSGTSDQSQTKNDLSTFCYKTMDRCMRDNRIQRK